MDIQGTEPESHSTWAGLVLGVRRLIGHDGNTCADRRWTVRDAWVPASTIYYAFPLPVIALMCGFSATVWWMVRRRLMAMLASGATLGCSCWRRVVRLCLGTINDIRASRRRASIGILEHIAG